MTKGAPIHTCSRCGEEGQKYTKIDCEWFCDICIADERAHNVLTNAHNKEGKKVYKKRWDSCNFGWYTDVCRIESKVYGTPCMVLISIMNRKNKVEHFHELYGG